MNKNVQGSPVRGRLLRRHVRVKACASHGDVELAVTIKNINEGGALVALSADAFAQGPSLGAGSLLNMRFGLDEADAAMSIDVQALVKWQQVIWHAGREALGVGVEFVDLSEGAARALTTFSENFRPAVSVLHPPDAPCDRLCTFLTGYFRVRCFASSTALVGTAAETEGGVVIVTDEAQLRELLGLRGSPGLAPMAFVLLAEESESSVALLHATLVPPSLGDAALVHHLQVLAAQQQLALENEMLHLELARANERITDNAPRAPRLSLSSSSPGIIGVSGATERLLVQIGQFGPSDMPVHIHGETGVGKELVARALHARSARAEKRFVAVNCAGIPEALLQSMLFGHDKGAFTGATTAHSGLLRAAHGGTLFLDELAELPLAMQGALLRVLEDKQVLPLGSSRPVPVDVRIVSATNKNLHHEVKSHRFRADLYYRLVVAEVSVQPLRLRREDILPIAHHYLEHLSLRHGKAARAFSKEAASALASYDWPGNVRELKHEVERAVVLCGDSQVVTAAMLSERVRAGGSTLNASLISQQTSASLESGANFDVTIERWQRTLIAQALDSADGVVSKAADVLGMERSRLTKLSRRLGLR